MSDDKLFVHIVPSEKRESLPDCGTYDKCQHCGGTLEQGFGLAGGGYGVYDYCPEHGIAAKTLD